MKVSWLPKVQFSLDWKCIPPSLFMFDKLEQLKYRIEHVKSQYELVNKEIASINTFDKSAWSDLRVATHVVEQLNMYREGVERLIKDIEQPDWRKQEETNGFTSRID